jgi:pyrophosphate--fructose-6-phosphate 1-phosphotransferase
MDGFIGGVSIPLSEYSEVQLERMEYVPSLPPALLEPAKTGVAIGESTVARASSEEAVLRSWFPALYGQPIVELKGDGATSSRSTSTATLRVGVVFCGRQTPGAHNVVCGLYDHLTALSAGNEILGFDGGTKGFFDGKARRLTADTLAPFRNQGGMHMLGRSVDRIRSGSEQAAALATAEALKLDGLVLVGGTFTNTDAAHLAEFIAERQAGGALQTRVVGVPVTIDGDIRNEFVEVSLGHDTATKLYSQLTGNMATDSNSAKKYWYWCRLMGRTTGHVALEVALQTHPNAILLGEWSPPRLRGSGARLPLLCHQSIFIPTALLLHF